MDEFRVTKSTFSRWLADQHSYQRLPDGDEPGAGFLDDAFRLVKARDDVVIDWGFPVNDISAVRRLMASGPSAWWFDG
jgi:hypothetical protein